MHGEYKVPGGKLVVVDLEVREGVLRDVRVAGDFFLEPDSALDAINAAVEGLAADADANQIAAAVRAALPEDTELFGITPEAVGTVVRRAVTSAPDWSALEWEVIRGDALPPRMHLALDEVLTARVGAGLRKPTLRFWEWAESAVVIGSFQSYRNEVDPEGAARHGFEVVRRISGGGAMLIRAGQTVTYSLYVPSSMVAGMSFAESYAYLDDWVLQGLRSLGIEATYQPLNDITSPAGKIGGAAQKRLAGGGVLHHVTMAYDMDGDIMTQVLRIGREKLSDKGTKSAAKRVDPLRSQTGLAREEVVDRLAETFVSLTGATEGSVTPEEFADAERLIEEKFATEAWLHRVP